MHFSLFFSNSLQNILRYRCGNLWGEIDFSFRLFSCWGTEKQGLTPGSAVIPSRGHDASAVFLEKGFFFHREKRTESYKKQQNIRVFSRNCSWAGAAWNFPRQWCPAFIFV